ncbi:deoxycytidylate deaminase [Lacihabitans sp. CCS-44]|uniref:anti-phage dCTP deaminase n=1 Tax=Lacihabitans sp. CCS-44 TaxID=2487331 RepID=UPI0020CEB102|nr:anti-phage dCTP deaminase [Lacihabitans sp. CCS-44]MCP9754422.1 deoxycytidylate deaminase [Lacihabitans sp. CCS-44]
MANAVLKSQKNISNKENITLGSDIGVIKKIKNTHTEELIISICGFIGTDINSFIRNLQNVLVDDFKYETKVIKMSEFIVQKSSMINSDITKITQIDRYNQLIECGNDLRERFGKSVLAELAINQIITDRIPNKESSFYQSKRVCYIINSIKNQEELDLFNLVYQGIHFSFGIFSSINDREKYLKNNKSMTLSEIYQIIDRDSGEEFKHGQTVRDTFTESDFFINVSDTEKSLKVKIERYLSLIFNSNIITPTSEETAMYQASSAANNSACLSRQVGAALTDSDNNIISLGWNDVPKYGGNLYSNESKSDFRCMNFNNQTKCWNDQEKNLISKELTKILLDEKLINQENEEQVFNKIRNSKIKSLVEFSRSIHAEMHALIIGSQIAGDKVKGGKIYITTYPCHNCARHLIVAGIEEIYYIEPYRKSLTMKLHYDAMTENNENNKVKILMYEGVSPRKYMDLFKMIQNSRKNSSGEMIDYIKNNIQPKKTLSLQAIPTLESLVTKDLISKKLLNETEE